MCTGYVRLTISPRSSSTSSYSLESDSAYCVIALYSTIFIFRGVLFFSGFLRYVFTCIFISSQLYFCIFVAYRATPRSAIRVKERSQFPNTHLLYVSIVDRNAPCLLLGIHHGQWYFTPRGLGGSGNPNAPQCLFAPPHDAPCPLFGRIAISDMAIVVFFAFL